MLQPRLLCLLAVLLSTLTVCFARHESPIQLYGAGGKGIATENPSNYGTIMSCFIELADINRDGSLSRLELTRVFEVDRYLTSTEKLYTSLNADTLLRRCDADKDGALSVQELTNETPCISTAQTEAIARYMCSRAFHVDMGYEDYTKAYRNVMNAAQEGKSIFGVIRKELAAEAELINPNAGRLTRLEFTPEELIGLQDQVNPATIYFFFLAIFLFISILILAYIIAQIAPIITTIIGFFI